MNELLSQYVDGALDSPSREAVEKHLATCDHCAAELDDLVSYLEAVRSMGRVAAPHDLLRNIHCRLEQPSAFRKLANRLLYPLHAKSPLKWAGPLAALLVLIITYHGVQVSKETGVRPHVGHSPRLFESREAPAGRSSGTALDESQMPLSAPQSEPTVAPAGGPKPIELALLVTPAQSVGGTAGHDDEAGPGGSRDLPAPVDRQGTDLKPVSPQPHPKPLQAPAFNAREARRLPSNSETTSREEKAGSAKPLEADKEALGKGELSQASRPARSRRPKATDTQVVADRRTASTLVQECIRNAGGTILAVNSQMAADHPESITAAVPIENLTGLIGKLRLIGRVTPSPEIPPPTHGQQEVELRIKLMFPQ